MNYTLPTGEVVDLDIDDILEIDFSTPKGKAAMQEIIFYKDYIKCSSTEEAEIFGSIKFLENDASEEDIFGDIIDE